MRVAIARMRRDWKCMFGIRLVDVELDGCSRWLEDVDVEPDFGRVCDLSL